MGQAKVPPIVQQTQLAMTALAVVPDSGVVEHRVSWFDPGVPLLSVQELDLHP